VALAAVLQDWRERTLRACAAAFGHRLMMDAVIPGGVAIDIAGGGVPAILAVLEGLQDALPGILRVIDSHASLLDRLVGTGVIAREVAHRFAAPGVAGRACGRARDTRGAEWPDLPVPARTEGDVDARLRVRLEELGTSAALLRLILADLPDGALAVPMEPAAGEGLGVAEGFRGECWHWLRLDGGGQISAAFAADPSWRLWPLLEHAAMGNIVADFPLINKSLNASYSGVDL
jgi:Ni,Fe-hydrogenase III large subunit